jgi:hypothetical protein
MKKPYKTTDFESSIQFSYPSELLLLEVESFFGGFPVVLYTVYSIFNFSNPLDDDTLYF